MNDTEIDEAVRGRLTSLESQRDMYRQWIETFDPSLKRYSEVEGWVRDLDRIENRLEELRLVVHAIKTHGA